MLWALATSLQRTKQIWVKRFLKLQAGHSQIDIENEVNQGERKAWASTWRDRN